MISALVDAVLQKQLNFEQLEKLLWNCTLGFFRHLMVEVLEQLDEKLMKERDKARFKNHEKNPRSIQTLVGNVDFKRRYYKDNETDDWVYLLDEALEIESEKNIGPGLLELAVTWATKGPSYRDARDRLTDLYGAQVLSHEAIRQALLEVGASCELERKNQIVAANGQREVAVLFIEADSFYVKFQKNKKLRRSRERREVKLAVIHEGWAPRHNGSKRDYRLVNPTYICSFEESEDFWEHVRGVIGSIYRNIDKLLIVINGDGAEWIRQGTEHFAHAMYQYDRFHIARDIHSALRHDPKALRKALKALKADDLRTLHCVVTESHSQSENAVEKEGLAALCQRLLSNSEYIVDYRTRLREQGVEVPADWRGTGAAESNVNMFKNRTGKRGRAWSTSGISAILTTLTHLFEGTLREHICRTLGESEEWLLEKITTGAGRIIKETQSRYTGIRRGGFPAAGHGMQGFAKLFNRLQYVEVF